MSRLRWIGLGAVLLGMSSSAIMQTMIATSLPSMERELGGMQLYSWVFGAYMLTSTISIPIFARLADLIGRRTLYLSGLGIFLLGSILIGFSDSMGQVVAFRVLQGLGAGIVAPAALASIGDLFGETERGRIFGIAGLVQVLSNLIGPPLGGWITDTHSWRWGFFVVLIPGIISLGLAWIGLPNKTEKRDWRDLHLDWQGSLLVGAGLGLGLLGVQWVGEGGQMLPIGLASLFGSAVLLWFFQRWESKNQDPVIPLGLISSPNLWRAVYGALLLGLVTHSALAYLPLYLEKIQNFKPADTGIALIPMLLMAGVGSGIGGQLTVRFPRQIQIAAWLLILTGFAFLGIALPYRTGFVLGLIGLGLGLAMPEYYNAAQREGGTSRLATSSGLIQMARNLGGAMGIPLLSVWLVSGGSNRTEFSLIFLTLSIIGFSGLLVTRSLSTPNGRISDEGRSEPEGRDL